MMNHFVKRPRGGGALSVCLLLAPMAVLTPQLPAAQTSAAETRAASSTPNEPKENNVLAWTEWELTSPVYEGLGNKPFLKFTDTRLGASVGLNSIGGAYVLDGQKITVKALMSTRMAGPEAVMKAESQYIKALEGVRTFALSENGEYLTLHGDQRLSFRLTGRTAEGFVPESTKILNVAPQLGPDFDGDRTPKYLQLEDLTEGVSWGRFTEEKILGFDFQTGYRYQLRVVVERNRRSGDKRLRLQEIISQQWTPEVKLETNQKIFEVAPTRVDCVGIAPMKCLQVRELGGQWQTFYAPIEGFDFREGWRYRLQVAVTPVENPPADAPNKRYTLVRLLDKSPVTQ